MNVANQYKVYTADEMAKFVKTFDQSNPKWSDLLTIDYFYHHHEADYDFGLSFIDRIYKKLGQFHPEWDVIELKNNVIYSNTPVVAYSCVINFMLQDPRDVLYYGI
jgi:hypothetical protein